MPLLEPFLLERIMMPKVWGGRALSRVLGLELPAGEDIGETWELYDRAEGSSRLRHSARTLAQVMQEAGEALVGKGVARAHGGRFPLLLKFLDARDGLSVQVHPDDAQASRDRDSGKNECCVVLHAGPEARIVRGLRPGVSREQFVAAATTAECEALLCTFRPEVGDTIHIPPGTVHAIGPDVVVFEVQQNSDLTYRLYDWGRGRQVHVEKALAVLRVDDSVTGRPVVAPVPLPDGGTQLIATADFRVRRYSTRQPIRMMTDGRFVTVTVVAGRGALTWPGERTVGQLPLLTGDTVLVPACQQWFALQPTDHLNVMICDPGVR
jgi:mannose-6-phosphate isomerase